MNNQSGIKYIIVRVGIEYLRCSARQGYLLMALYFLSSVTLSSQQVWELEIDSIFLKNDTDIEFINQGVDSKYECDLDTEEQRDYDYVLTKEYDSRSLACWKEDKHVPIDLQALKTFKDIKKMKSWMRDKSFTFKRSKSSREYSDKVYYLQYVDENFFLALEYDAYDDGEEKFRYCTFIRYAYLSINESMLSILFLQDDGYYPHDIIIPGKNASIGRYEKASFYGLSARIDSIDILSYFRLSDHYRIQKKDNQYQLYDKVFNTQILAESFDTIVLNGCYIAARKDGKFWLYDKLAQPINRDNIKAIKGAFFSHQIIMDDAIRYLDCNQVMHDTMPKGMFIGHDVGGNYWRSIDLVGTDVVEYTYSSVYDIDLGDSRNVKKDSSILFSVEDDIIAVQYLDGSTMYKFEAHQDCVRSKFCFHKYFSSSKPAFIAKTKKSDRLISIENIAKDKRKAIYKGYNYCKYSQYERDSLKVLVEAIEDEYILKIHYEGQFESYGYNHPIKFQENDLYGYFPQNKEAKYTRLEKFDLNFAEFTLPDGRQGWLDIEGDEYFRD